MSEVPAAAATEPKKLKHEKREKHEKHEKKEKHHHKEKDQEPKEEEEDSGLSPTSPLPEPGEDFEANKKDVESLCKNGPNSQCADCNASGTRWAPVNHGVFVCIRCSGIHRSLGTHISKVKSTNLDKWTKVEIEMMRAIGNQRGKEIFEKNVPRGGKPGPDADDNTIRSYIEKKYVEKAYAVEGFTELMKKLQKETGYKGKKRGLISKEDFPKHKKEKAAEGRFGAITVTPEEHDEKRLKVLAAFGVTS